MSQTVTLSRALVRQWKALSWSALPADVRHQGMRHVIDAIGVGLAASAMPQGAPYARYAQGLAAGPSLLLNGMGGKAMADAALLNGGLIHSLEYDDTHTASIVHGSAVLCATSLAVAQAQNLSPVAMLCATIKAYEILIRMGLAGQGGFQKHGFQITSVAGTLVAALLACDLMGGDEEACVHAIGIALSQSSGVFEFLTNGSTVKSFHPGWAAHAGVVAATMACAGLKGPETAIEGTRGLYQAFARDTEAASRLSRLMDDFGSVWHISALAVKLVPSCHYLHGFVEIADEVMQVVGDPARIQWIDLQIAEATAPIVCEPWADKQNPPTGHAIRWSLPVLVAMKLIEGEVGLQSFVEPPSAPVLALAQKMSWSKLDPHHFPTRFEARMLVTLVDGQQITAYRPDVWGNASRPVGDDVLFDKFRTNARHAVSDAQVENILKFWLSYDTAEDFKALSDAMTNNSKGL